MRASPVVHSLPILDLRQFDGNDAERWFFLERLRGAARDVGFFYLRPWRQRRVCRNAALSVSPLLRTSRGRELAIEMVNSPNFRGDIPAWAGSIPAASPIGANSLTSAPSVRRCRTRRISQLGPASRARINGPPLCRNCVLSCFAEEATALSIRLVRAFAASLGQAEDIFEPIYAEKPNQLVKIIHYPRRGATESDQGVGAHKDSGFVTVLLQEKQSGLQVEGADGWIDAAPIPGAFVINVGELLELASNGYFRATADRVVTPRDEHDRLSAAFFLGARLDSVVPVLSLASDLTAQARSVTQDPHNPLFHEVGRNYLKGRLRSHPDVARRRYPDLLNPEELGGRAAPGSAY